MIRRVLEGGEGLTRAGTFQRSMEVGFSFLVDLFDSEVEESGTGGEDAWIAIM